MSAHNRKALLRAFYGLATLWLINGVFGLVRASGPGALLPYIEIAALLAYWAWVFNWWRKHKPRTRPVEAKQKLAKSTSTMTSDDIAAAVDREEAISRERNRRRKQRLQRSAGEIGEQFSEAIYRFRFALIGVLVLVASAGTFAGYQEIDATLKRQENTRVREAAAAENQARVRSVLSVWDARNNCLTSGFNMRWKDWYEQNPETQTVEYFSKTQLKRVKITKTLPTPESLDQVSWIGTTYLEKPKVWFVTRAHFDPLLAEVKQVCLEKWPPPAGLDEQDMELDFIELLSGGYSTQDEIRAQWIGPFPTLW